MLKNLSQRFSVVAFMQLGLTCRDVIFLLGLLLKTLIADCHLVRVAIKCEIFLVDITLELFDSVRLSLLVIFAELVVLLSRFDQVLNLAWFTE